MNYFLLDQACENKSRSKVKVSKWLGIEPAEKYHHFVLQWHDFRREMVEILSAADEEQAKQLNLYLLRTFYLTPYDTSDDFYQQFEHRCVRLLSNSSRSFLFKNYLYRSIDNYFFARSSQYVQSSLPIV